MLKKLYIENYLYIKSAVLDFSNSLNIIIGESGVGKSLIINVLTIPMGQVPSEEVVGKWGQKTTIKLIIGVTKNSQTQDYFKWGNDNSLEAEVRIEIEKKTIFFLNGEQVSAKKIKNIFSTIFDLHSQNNFELVRSNQLQILSNFMRQEEKQVLESFQFAYEDFDKLNKNIAFLKSNIFDEDKLELNNYKLQEISKINPKINEDLELFEQLKMGRQGINIAQQYLSFNEKLEEASSSLNEALFESKELMNVTSKVTSIQERLASCAQELEDITWEFSRNKDVQAIEEIDILETESRLSLVEGLKSKYKMGLKEVIAFKDDLLEKINKQEEYKLDLIKLSQEKESQSILLTQKAQELTQVRQQIALRIINLIKESFIDLKLEKTEMTYTFSTKDSIDENGQDNFEFLIKVNVGSAFHSLHKLSGGETSRIMLALKTALMSAAQISTYIFDEIDVGVSGEVAKRMADVLAKMSVARQLIIITHLPMIALKANRIFKIQKEFLADSTEISIQTLTDKTIICDTITKLLT